MSEPAASPAAAAAANDSPVAPPYPPSNTSLPLGLGVLRTYSGALVCLEVILGGLVWILVASSNVPVPLFQGWVLFVSLTAFILSAAYLALLITGFASRINADLNFLDVTYHFFALLFYFGAFVLEAGLTAANGGASITPLVSNSTVLCITPPPGNIITLMTNTQYSINVAATVFAFVVTVCYGCSVMMGFRRWTM